MIVAHHFSGGAQRFIAGYRKIRCPSGPECDASKDVNVFTRKEKSRVQREHRLAGQ
jgi:hypothetical protein